MRALKLLTFTLILWGSSGLIVSIYYQSKAKVAQMLLNNAWVESQRVHRRFQDSQHAQNYQAYSGNLPITKPWPWADTWPVLKLELPALEQSMIVLADSSGQSLAFGPGLHTPQTPPGNPGHSIIAAHRDTHFKFVKHLELGQEIIIERMSGKRLLFRIDQIRVVNSLLEQPNLNIDEQRLTLVTCIKPGDNEANSPLRYLVSAELMD